MYTIRTKGKNKRDILQTELAKKGVGSQVHYIPIHKLDSFKKKFAKIKLPNTDFHFNNCLSIPNFYKLDNKKLKKIINSIQKITCES